MARLFRVVGRWIDNHLLTVLLSFIATTIATLVLWPYSVITIPSGQLGVRWSRFGGGTVMDRVYHEGTTLILPWDVMFTYDERLQKITHSYEVLAYTALKINVNVSFVIRLNPHNVPATHRFVGPDYIDKLIVPVIGFETQNAFASYRPSETFDLDRITVAEKIREGATTRLRTRFNSENDASQESYASIEDVLIGGITLPPLVTAAIERKSSERQRAETYQFLLPIERGEAERRAIEAAGIRRFYEIVGDGLTDNYLRLKAIEATREVAQSPNSKIVVLGNNLGSLPLMLGADGAPLPAPPASSLPPAPAPGIGVAPPSSAGHSPVDPTKP